MGQVRAAGTQFAFIKATEGGDYLDPKLPATGMAAKRVGMPRGAYHMVYWCRAAEEQALWFILNVPFDPTRCRRCSISNGTTFAVLSEGIPPKLALEKIKIMLEVMELHTGKRPIIYTDVAFHRDVLQGRVADYNFWLRSVAAEPHEIFGADRGCSGNSPPPAMCRASQAGRPQRL